MSTTLNPQTTTDSTAEPLDMAGLSQILFGHAAFQYLNAACELELFELFLTRPQLSKAEIRTALQLQDRAVDILLLGVTSLGLLKRTSDGYALSAVVAELVAGEDWPRFKATVAFEQYIVYEGQLDFTESLRTNANAGLRRVPGTGRDLYHRLTENPALEEVFYRYMRSWSELANPHLVEQLDLKQTRHLLDCGGGDGVNAIALALANPDLKVTILEIEATTPIARQRIEENGLSDRVSVVSADMFADTFPTGFDCVMFAHQLVIWTLEQNTALLRKAYDALEDGGRIVIFNSVSNDAGDGPLVAALDSVYFAALPAEGGMIYSWEQHESCLRDAGFGRVERIRCPGWTPHGILIGVKAPASA